MKPTSEERSTGRSLAMYLTLIFVSFSPLLGCTTITTQPVYTMINKLGWVEEAGSCSGPLGIYSKNLAPGFTFRIGLIPGPGIESTNTRITLGVVDRTALGYSLTAIDMNVLFSDGRSKRVSIPSFKVPSAAAAPSDPRLPIPRIGIQGLLISEIVISDDVVPAFSIELPDIVVGEKVVHFQRLDFRFGPASYRGCVQ